MMMTSLKVSARGAIVLPAPLRKKYRLKPGAQVGVVDDDAGIRLVPLSDNPIKALRGSLKTGKPTMALLREGRRADEKHEALIERMFAKRKK
jgi:AbrB family looped-hinge helix DNA binding protein